MQKCQNICVLQRSLMPLNSNSIWASLSFQKKRKRMKNNNECPECGTALSAKYKRCTCGWRKEHEPVPVQADLGCQYQSKGRRCKLLGTMSHSTRANGIWYCHLHYHSLGDPKKG